MGNIQKNKIDQLFAEGLQNAEVGVPAHLWEGIASQVEQKRLRRKVFFARMTAAASILLVIGFGSWFLVDQLRPRSATNLFSSGNVISLPYVQGAAATEVDCDQPDAESAILLAGSTDKQDGTSPSKLQETKPVTKHQNPFEEIFARARAKSQDQSSTTPPSKGMEDGLSTGLADAAGTLSETDKFNALAVAREKEELAPKINGTTGQDIVPELVQDGLDALAIENEIGTTPKSELFLNSPEPFIVKNELFAFQEKKQIYSDGSRWSLGGSFSPDYNFANSTPQQNQVNPLGRSLALQDPAEAELEPNDLVTAFSTGINVAYQMTDRIGLRSGLTYSKRSTSSPSSVTSFGKTEDFSSDFSVNYVEIPLLMEYSLVNRENFNYYIASGLSANLLWNYNNVLTNTDGQIAAKVVSQDDKQLYPAQGNIMLRTGVRYKLFKKLSLHFEPGLKYGFVNNKYSFNSGNPLSLNLSSGVDFHF